MISFELLKEDAKNDVVLNENADDIMDTVLIENGQFVDVTPSNLKEDYSGDWKDIKIEIPGGDSEKPKSDNYDATSVKTSGSKEISASVYNKALDDLKKSFKESIEVMDMLKDAVIK